MDLGWTYDHGKTSCAPAATA